MIRDSIPTAGKSEKYKKKRRVHLVNLLAIVSVAAIAFFSFSNIFGYSYTDSDDLCFINSASVVASDDFGKLFASKLYTEVDIQDDLPSFFRPATKSLFMLEYSIWGLNPFGYHLTDVLMHTITSVIALLLLITLTGGRKLTAWLGALIFATHPILIELIPTASRRSDLLYTMLCLLTLLLFVKYINSGSRPKILLSLAIFTSVLALSAKETAVILPVLIFIYCLFFQIPESKTIKNRITLATKLSAPFWITAILFIVWRILVIQGTGAYWYVGKNQRLFSILGRLLRITEEYFSDIFFRLITTNHLVDPSLGTPKRFLSLVAFIFALGLLIIFRRALCRAARAGSRTSKIVRNILMMTALISFFSMLSYNLLAPYINQFIQDAYDDGGQKMLAFEINSRALPVEYYLFKAKNIALSVMLASLLVSLVLLFVEPLVHGREKAKTFIYSTQSGKVVIFSFVWLLISLLIFVASFNYLSYYFYISLFPFAAILSILTMAVLGYLAGTIRDIYTIVPLGRYRTETVLTVFLVVAGVSISHVSSIPIDANKQWGEIGLAQDAFYDKISEIVPQIPDNAIIYVYDYPTTYFIHRGTYGYPKQPGSGWSHTVKCWLNLHYPGNNYKVVFKNPRVILDMPYDLDMKITDINGEVSVNVIVPEEHLLKWDGMK